MLEDQRVRITKRMIQESLIQLSESKPVAYISVRELCDKAQINRSTFYRHYDTTYDVLIDIRDHYIQELGEIVKNAKAKGDTNHLVLILKYDQEHKELVKLLREASTVDYYNTLANYAGFTNYLDEKISCLNNPERKYYQEYIIWGALKIIESWINDGCIESCEEIAKIILFSIHHGLNNIQSGSK